LATADSKLGVVLACGRSNSTTSFFIGVLPHTDDVSILKFIEVHWGLSPITARSAQPGRFAELDPPIRMYCPCYAWLSARSITNAVSLNCSSPGLRCVATHSNQNIYLVSSHPYVSPFMLHPCLATYAEVSPFRLIKPDQVGYCLAILR
jgi:hypothetical protein